VEDSAIFRVRLTDARQNPNSQPVAAVRLASIALASVARGSYLAKSVSMANVAHEQGSSLVEALVATLILTTAVVTMARLLASATATNLAARHNTVAMILAEQKVEQLRAEITGGTSVQASPAAALEQNTPGFVDHVGSDGTIVGSNTQPLQWAVYTRRWSIEPVSASPESSLIIQVLVIRRGGSSDQTGGSAASGSGAARRLHGDARLVTVKARKGR
jgi:hypothetical protein